MLKIERLSDESLEKVSGGDMSFSCTKNAALICAPEMAGVGACAGIIVGSINGAKAAKKYADEKNMSLAKKMATVAVGAVSGFVGGGIAGATLGAASGALLGAGFGLSTDMVVDKIESL